MVKIILAAAALMLALLLVIIAIMDPAVGIRSKPASTADNSEAVGQPPSAAVASGDALPDVGSQEASSLQTASASAHNDKQIALPAVQDDKLSALPAVPGHLNGQTAYNDNWPDRNSIEENDTVAILCLCHNGGRRSFPLGVRLQPTRSGRAAHRCDPS